MTDSGTTDTPGEVLARIVDTCAPDSILCCGTEARKVAAIWQQHHQGARISNLDSRDPNAGLPPAQVHDLALISGTLEQLPYSEGALLLGQLRNFGTRQIAALVGKAPDWAFTDFISLGFRRHARLTSDAGEYTLYTYNLDTYNHKRAWNNPDNWANPDMWGKAWW